jgi:hypothetical protein
MEKQIEIPGKMKKSKQPSLAQPGRAPVPLPALSLSLSAQWGRTISTGFPRLCVPLPLPRGPASPDAKLFPPRACSLSRYIVGPPCQLRLPRARREPARAHSRTHAKILGHAALPRTPAPFLAPPAPALAFPSHFSQPRPLSRSAHAARPRR